MFPAIRVQDSPNGRKGDHIMVSWDDVLYVRNGGKYLLYETADDVFRLADTLTSVGICLRKVGLPFESIDRTSLVNLNQVDKVDYNERLVWFLKSGEKRSKFVEFAVLQREAIKKLLSNFFNLK